MNTDNLKLVLLGIFAVSIVLAFLLVSMILPPPPAPNPTPEGVVIDIKAETVK